MSRRDDLIGKLVMLEQALCNNSTRSKFDELINDVSAQFYYKSFTMQKASLSTAKTKIDEMYYVVKNILNAKKDGVLNNFPFERYGFQLQETKEFLTALTKIAGVSSSISCTEFIDRLSKHECTDEVLANVTIPWSIYSAMHWYLPNKWNNSKRVFSVDYDWVEYLRESLEMDMSLETLNDCPYNTFALTMFANFEDEDLSESDRAVIGLEGGTGLAKVASTIIDFDRVNKKLHIVSHIPQHTKDTSELYESCIYMEMTIRGTLGETINTIRSYAIDDSTNFELFFSSSHSYSREIDFKTETLTTAFFSSRNEADADIISDVDCGRYRQGIIGRKRVRKLKPDEPERVLNQILGTSVLGFMLYLSAENSAKTIVKREPAVSDNVVRTKSRGTKRKAIHSPIDEYNVAVREVKLLKQTNPSVSPRSRHESPLTRGSVRPHIRKAHWHHFWVGKHNSPERRLSLRFVMPTLVGGSEANIISNTTLKGFEESE